MNGIEVADDALHLKELGNQEFKCGHYDKAIEYYTNAIRMLNIYRLLTSPESQAVDKRTLAICLTNRAQCHIRHEEFGIRIVQEFLS
jgi:hypothetical protein